MEQLRPRLLKTYAGRRGQATTRPAAAAAAAAAAPVVALRRCRLPPWISPQVDPKHLFSSSSASSLSSPASPFDPEFQPPKRKPRRRAPATQRAPRRKQQKGGSTSSSRKAKRRPKSQPGGGGEAEEGEKEEKENQPPSLEKEPPHLKGPTLVRLPPTPLRRNVTCRPRRAAQPRLPLLCSTPESAAAALRVPAEAKEGTPGRWLPCDLEEVLGGGGDLGGSNCSDVLVIMDGERQELRGSLKLFSPDSSSRHDDLQTGPLSISVSRFHFRSPCVPRHSSPQLSRPWSKVGPSSGGQEEEEERVPATGHFATTCLLQSPPMDHSRLGSPKIKSVPCRQPQGAFQLQAVMRNGRLALFDTPCPQKRRHTSVHSHTVAQKAVEETNGISVESCESSINQSSPLLQPVVVLDSQVVQDWLSSHSFQEEAVVPLSQGKKSLPSESPSAMPGVSDISSISRAFPAPKAGESTRRACISGFSSKRWQPHGKQMKGRKNQQRKPADPFLLRETLHCKTPKQDLTLSLLSPDSLFKNCSLWRRIRASFSLHKKKIVLSEAESFNSSADSVTSVSSHFKEVLKTPFTQKLGYSICPSSSMVLLSSMTDCSATEVMLSDAEKVYGECQQRGPISFEGCISPDKMEKCVKVGEGVFGEVFRTESEKGTVALKIIPIEGKKQVNGEPQKTFSEILPEIIISKELSLLANEAVNQTSGFISLYSVHCVQGSYPGRLLAAWDEYHNLKGSENDRPDFFEDQQLFMVLEFEFGGADLENMRSRHLNSVIASRSILHQVTASLAVAEEALHFEHRDLHWGNVLVKKTDLKTVSYTLKGETHTLPTQGILVNIIDYTFSRLEKDGLTVYCDLSADEEVFQGKGDYQFDIYRQMREENANRWSEYFPRSNVLWLHYLTDKLLKEVSYKKKPTTSSLKQAHRRLKGFSEEILSFRSATEALNSSSFFQ